ncbi:MAG: SUMF1/EgtB/PvdO family nonheme iron enzyme [Planctomycetota bacterium]|jgi:formylglycine-generating enzyme required for sulfatase activity
MKRTHAVSFQLAVILFLVILGTSSGSELPREKEFVNSLGMKFVRIQPGRFQMGQIHTPLPPEIRPLYRGRGYFDCLMDGDFDERPVHKVKISRPFYIGIFEVTNYQYELFDPAHQALRDKAGQSSEDDAAVTHVSHYDAEAFCQWLSDKEGLPYRLPTEAEWEYACRAGTETHYNVGDVLTPQKRKTLRVGQAPSNAWGLFDMHGNVEEWCRDWYGPYRSGSQTDPLGYAVGDFRVVRSGVVGNGERASVYFLRSANRMGALPEDRTATLGFRVVLGNLPQTRLLPQFGSPRNQQRVVARPLDKVTKGPDPTVPYFHGPRRYVNMPRQANGPVFAAHNHDPAITECPNGDLLAVWYTCVSESNRELGLAASRLRFSADQWEPASPFWNVPDRNDHAPALGFNGKDTIYHFNGMAPGSGHQVTSLILRTSKDSGANWSRARLILPGQRIGKPSEPMFRTRDGAMVLGVDGRPTLLFSYDEGITWFTRGGGISGFHAAVAEMSDGGLIAFGRTEGGQMPVSISRDGGTTFTYADSEFPAVGGGQRSTLLRLKEGPLLLCSFADAGITVRDAAGREREVYGLFAALSDDNGRTWYHKRLISDGSDTAVECTDGGLFLMSQRQGEFRGYLGSCQSLDGLIHIISSRQHYAMNLAWLRTPSPALTRPALPVEHIVETFSGPYRFDLDGWRDYKSYEGGFNGKGQYVIDSLSHHNGLNRLLGEGSFDLRVNFSNIRYYPRGERVSEGAVLWFRDGNTRWLALAFKEDQIKLEIKDADTDKPITGARLRPGRGWMIETKDQIAETPRSVKLRLLWNHSTQRLRIYYGLNGDEPVHELPLSRTGIYYGKPLSDSNACYFLMSNGSIDLDHFEIKPF